MKHLLSIMVLLATSLVASAQTSVTWSLNNAHTGTDVLVFIQSPKYLEDHNSYLVSVSWESANQAETVTRVVKRSWLGGIPAMFWSTYTAVHVPVHDFKVTRIQVTPVLTKYDETKTLVPGGVGGLPNLEYR